MSEKIKLDIECPRCRESLYTDNLADKHAWCLNEECTLYIKIMPPYDLMFSKVNESFIKDRNEI